jgi:hypothetical protein
MAETQSKTTTLYALSNIQVGDKDGEIREIPYGEKVTGITKEQVQELIEAKAVSRVDPNAETHAEQVGELAETVENQADQIEDLQKRLAEAEAARAEAEAKLQK